MVGTAATCCRTSSSGRRPRRPPAACRSAWDSGSRPTQAVCNCTSFGRAPSTEGTGSICRSFPRTAPTLPATFNFTRITGVKVIVIGAGVIGCAVAYKLASRRADVEVVDPRAIAAGATHASAGMLAPYSEGHHQQLLSLGVASLARYDAFVERLHGESHVRFEYER